MIGVVYLGSNPKTQERLKYIPGQSVKMMTAYKEAASICTPRFPNEHFILFFEKNEQNEDVTAIKYIRNKCKDVYIILLTDPLTAEERIVFQKCGINDTLAALCGLVEVTGDGFFRSGFLPRSMSAREYADLLEENLETTVRIMGPETRSVRRVGLCSGSGGSEWTCAAEAGCDAFVSGEIRHHHALALADAGITAFECGHFATEEPGLAALAEALQNAISHVECNVRVFVSAVSAYSNPRRP